MESHNITLKAHHTLKNKIKFYQTCLSFWVSQLSLWPHTSHSSHPSHCSHSSLVGTFSQSLQSVPASSSLHVQFLNWNSHSKQRSLQLSGLLFLRRQWGVLNNSFSCHACICIFRGKNLKKIYNTLFSPEGGIMVYFHFPIVFCTVWLFCEECILLFLHFKVF